MAGPSPLAVFGRISSFHYTLPGEQLKCPLMTILNICSEILSPDPDLVHHMKEPDWHKGVLRVPEPPEGKNSLSEGTVEDSYERLTSEEPLSSPVIEGETRVGRDLPSAGLGTRGLH